MTPQVRLSYVHASPSHFMRSAAASSQNAPVANSDDVHSLDIELETSETSAVMYEVV